MFWGCAACVWGAVFVALEQIYAILFALQPGKIPCTTITAIRGSRGRVE